MTRSDHMPSGGACVHEERRCVSRRQTWLHVSLLVVLCGVLYFHRAGSLPLQDPDESRYALIVRQMLRTGRWVVPHEGGKTYLDKPAPFLWLVGVGEVLTGRVELGGRGVAALSGMVTVLVSCFLARRMWDARTGLVSGVVLATMWGFVGVARWLRMDMPFTAAMWTALWCFWRSESGVRGSGRPSSWYGFYVSCAVATLLKGPAGLLLPAVVVGTYLVLSGRPRRLLELLNVRAVLLYLLIAAPWYVTVSVLEPGYAWEFFVRQNLARFTGHGFASRSHGDVLSALLLVGGLLPWAAFLPGVCVRYFPRRWRLRAERPGVLFLWVAVLVPMVFFVVSRCTRGYYFLPVLPPLAVMIGAVIDAWAASDGRTSPVRWGAAALCLAVLAAVAGPVVLGGWLGMTGPWLAVPVALAVPGAAGMYFSLRGGRRALCVVWTAVVVVTGLLFTIEYLAPRAYEHVSTRRLAALVDPATAASATFCAWERRHNSFEYYTGAPLFLAFRRHLPGDLQKLVELLASDRLVYCLVSSDARLAELKQASRTELFVLGESGGCWLVSNRRPRDPGE